MEPARSPIYDEDDKKPVTKPNLKALEGGSEGDGKPQGVLKDASALDADQLAKKEQTSSKKKSGFKFSQEAPDRFSKLKGQLTKNLKKRVAIGVVAGVVGVGGFGGFLFLQGPFKFVHFAQNLRKFHLASNEDFGNDRGSRILTYALYGLNPQASRLGISANAAANRYEKIMIEQTGMRPAYSKTGRHIGFEIVNEDKAYRFLSGYDADSPRKSNERIAESVMGGDVEIVDPNNVKDGNGSKISATSRDGTPVKGKVLNTAKQGYADRRVWIRSFGRQMSVHNVVAAIGSKLLIKRGGVSIHMMNYLKDKLDESVNARLDEDRTKKTEKGGIRTIGDPTTYTDESGNQDPADLAANDETKSFIQQFKETGAFKSTRNGAIVVGILCAARSVGNGVENIQYENNYLTQMRIGMGAVSTGQQVQANDDFSAENLKYVDKFTYDPVARTSFDQAETYVAESGGSGGVPVTKEADLKQIGGKAPYFAILDKIPLLGTACNIQEGIFGLWGIKQVSGWISDATTTIADQALKVANTSVDELITSGLNILAGKSVDPLARGAKFGNYATTGAFIAGNDMAMSMGGGPLSQAQTAELKYYQSENEQFDNSQKSFYARYLDPRDSSTMMASMIDGFNVNKISSIITKPFGIFGSNNVFVKKASAAGNPGYDYGIAKQGFSLALRNDSRFEDPFVNATIVEPQLDVLNQKYGACFGTTITTDDSGVHIQTDKSVNVFSKEYKDNCQKFTNTALLEKPDKQVGFWQKLNPFGSEQAFAATNTDQPMSEEELMYNRYRFYLADSVSAVSEDCNNGNPTACAELQGGLSNGSTTDGGAYTLGDMNATITINSPGEFITLPSKYSCPGRTTQIDSRIAPALAYILDTYNLCADDGLANGHKSHGAGFGVDVRPRDQSKASSKDEWKNTAEKFLRDINWWGDSATDPKSTNGCATYVGYGNCVGGAKGPTGSIPKWVRWLGYNGDVDHGDPWHIFGGSYAHIHIGWQNPSGDAVSSTIISPPRSNAYTFPAPIADDIRPLLSKQLLAELDSKTNLGSSFELKQLSPYLSTSGGTINPTGITLHWWGSGGGINQLASTLRSRGLSVQIGITSDGQVYQMTKNLNDLTAHATGANTTTIGIEIEGGPADFGAGGITKYPKKFEAVVATVKMLMQKYNIPATGRVVCGNVVGVHPHKAYNNCPGAVTKDDIDDYYFNEVMKRVQN